VLFAFGVIPIAFVASLTSPIHAKLFLTDHSLTVMEHAWPVPSALARSAQQPPWRGHEEFNTSAFGAFVREHQRPHLELARALWRVVDRCVASIGGEAARRGERGGRGRGGERAALPAGRTPLAGAAPPAPSAAGTLATVGEEALIGAEISSNRIEGRIEVAAESPSSSSSSFLSSSSSSSSQSLLGESPLANTSFPGEMPKDNGDVNCSSGRASSAAQQQA